SAAICLASSTPSMSVRLGQQLGPLLRRNAGLDEDLFERHLASDRGLAVCLVAACKGRFGQGPRGLDQRDGAANGVSEHLEKSFGEAGEQDSPFPQCGDDLSGYVKTAGDVAP